MHIVIKVVGLACAFGLVMFLGIEGLSKTVKLPIVALHMLIILFCLKKESSETRSKKSR